MNSQNSEHLKSIRDANLEDKPTFSLETFKEENSAPLLNKADQKFFKIGGSVEDQNTKVE